MAGKAYTEPIEISVFARVADGFGGFTKGGETVRYNTIATITERTNSPYSNDSSLSLSKTCDVELWRNPDVDITIESIVSWRGGDWRVREVKESDNRLKYFLKITK